jgi:hypothetical protein
MHHTMKAWGEWRYSSAILYLGAVWGWVFSFTHQPLYLRGKSHGHSFNRRLGGPQSPSGRWSVQKYVSLPSAANRNSAVQRRPSLYRLSYPNCNSIIDVRTCEVPNYTSIVYYRYIWGLQDNDQFYEGVFLQSNTTPRQSWEKYI